MEYSIFIDPCSASIRMIEQNDLTGNTDWIRVELNEETALLLTDHLLDDHGAPMYKWVDGVVIERTEEERRAEWPPDPEPEPDYRATCEQIFAILDGEAE